MKLDLQNYSKRSISFEKNEGQTASQVDFIASGTNHRLFLMPSEITLVFMETIKSINSQKISSSVLSINLSEGNKEAKPMGMEKLDCKSNYFIGSDPEKWKTNISNYSKVKYEDVYPGIDMIYYGDQDQYEWDFVVHPGSDPNIITLDFQGVDKLEVNDNKDLILHLKDGQIVLKKPFAYQEVNGERVSVTADFDLGSGCQAGFILGGYNPSKLLIIDPILTWSTYYGGSNSEVGSSIVVDSVGDVYITGYTQSTTFPNPASIYPYAAGWDAFVAKIKGDGSGVIFFTYIGGSVSIDPGSSGPHDYGYGIALDSNNNICITGTTWCNNFPVFNAIQGSNGGYCDAFVTKIRQDGAALIFSTYFGGWDYEQGWGIAADSAFNAYIIGYTSSSGAPPAGFPLQDAIQSIYGGSNDAFVTKVDAVGSLIYSTYLGGSGYEAGMGIIVDSNNSAYITGTTYSNGSPPPGSGFPTQNPFQPVNNGISDIFIAKISDTPLPPLTPQAPSRGIDFFK